MFTFFAARLAGNKNKAPQAFPVEVILSRPSKPEDKILEMARLILKQEDFTSYSKICLPMESEISLPSKK